MFYFNVEVSAFWGLRSLDPLPWLCPGPRWGLPSPRPLLCPPTMETDRRLWHCNIHVYVVQYPRIQTVRVHVVIIRSVYRVRGPNLAIPPHM